MWYIYFSGLIEFISLSIPFQGMYIVTPASPTPSRPPPAHPHLALAARHVVNPYPQVCPFSSVCPLQPHTPDPPPLPSVIPNPLFVPPHLRPYVLPPFRRIYLNAPASTTPVPTDADPASDPTAEEAEKVTARLHMENAVLRQSCHAWRARANAHVAAHLGLSALVRLARDQTRILKDERDELARKYDALKRKFSDVVR